MKFGHRHNYKGGAALRHSANQPARGYLRPARRAAPAGSWAAVSPWLWAVTLSSCHSAGWGGGQVVWGSAVTAPVSARGRLMLDPDRWCATASDILATQTVYPSSDYSYFTLIKIPSTLYGILYIVYFIAYSIYTNSSSQVTIIVWSSLNI